jgi:pilus assembly protein CpaC
MKNTLKIALLLLLTVSIGAKFSFGEDQERIILYKGELKIIPADNTTRIVIGNPNVVDVASISKTDMLMLAKDEGLTNLIWWDAKGQHAAQLEVLLESMTRTKERIDRILQQINVTGITSRSMDSEGKVLLMGSVKTPQELNNINLGLDVLKDKILNLIQIHEEESVIGINVEVLELNKDASSTLGFTWPGSLTINERGSEGISSTGTTWGRLFNVLNLSRSSFSLTLDALVQEGKARVLSSPSLYCQSGKEAELLVGGEKPILTTQVAGTGGGGTGTSVSYKEYGIKLKIKPSIADDQKIRLSLGVEVSEVQTAAVLGDPNAPTALAYPLTKRTASTELFLKDGQTMAIGGLKKQKTEEDIRKNTFLGDVPILGLLFKKKTTQEGGGNGERGDVELFIMLTPTIVKEGMKKEEPKPQPAPVVKEKAITQTVSPVKEEKPAEDKAKIKVVPSPKDKESVTKNDVNPKPALSAPKEAVVPKQEGAPKAAVEIDKKTPPVSDYIRKVLQQIRRDFVYPKSVKDGNLRGSLKLALRVSNTGQLMNVEVRESSGYVVLDENAVNTVKKAAPYPPFPPDMKQKELLIDLPIVYKTNR